jgi:hypothetical protein
MINHFLRVVTRSVLPLEHVLDGVVIRWTEPVKVNARLCVEHTLPIQMWRPHACEFSYAVR